MGEQSSIAGGGREIATSHNMRDVTRTTAVWYGTKIGGSGGGKTMTAQKAMATAAARVTATIPRGGGAWYLLGQVSLMTWAVREAASQSAVGGQGQLLGEVRARYRIKNVSVFCVFAFVLLLARCCCCLWAMEPHDVGLRAIGEVAPQPVMGGRVQFLGGGPRTVRDQEHECVLCVCVCSPPRPLLLLLTGNRGFGATLALLTHPNFFLFLIT